MEISYYPGCTLTGSARELDESFRSTAGAVGITLKELPDWTCCGASSAHMVDEYLETGLPAADLMLAQQQGLDVVAPCAACHLRLKAAAKKLKENGDLKNQFPFRGEISVLSGLEMFCREETLSVLKQRLEMSRARAGKPAFEGLRVAPYYGCLAVRPPEIVEPDDAENPMQMDRLLEVIGVQVVKWPYKTDCCGGSLALTRTDLVMKLSRKLLDMAKYVQADAIVTFCPMCQANLDTRQADISRDTGQDYQVPVLYLTELIGLALGDLRARSWFNGHMVSPVSLFSARGYL
jgi:heterodisulfide reductase subunit B